ncbi:tetratricopeptide repeat protein 5-like [Leguminivora glycinivorella]|uniref:tetratricopeptide repeat protein 5-like n=1 Tax=Leguminivora glycinivorella TaxID=1035111 RepID=UPI00200F30E4|nr:tetratricopeptide repeat protein 5-like [Leguminivora glycinivorella]
MATDTEEDPEILQNFTEVLDGLAEELKKLFEYRDLFFENNPIELAPDKNKLVDDKKEVLIEKFESIDDSQIPFSLRARFLYMKGRCYNISTSYDARATQCLSKAVKLSPQMVDAWNELGECYWKNMNVKEAKASFEGALKHERNRLSLRCLSIILRQETGDKREDTASTIARSVELAREAVSLDTKDGVSWIVLGNAYLCQFFLGAQDPAKLKLCMSAYKQALNDPVAKGQPDLYYNKGIALKFEEYYSEALSDFDYACRLDPPWELPRQELARLKQYLTAADDLARTRGRIKTKRLQQMVQSIDKKMLGVYATATIDNNGKPEPAFHHVTFDRLADGKNAGKVVLGKVVGSIHNENAVPFTFALVDASMECVLVTVYNWADGRGAIIGDSVAIPEPKLTTHKLDGPLAKYGFKSIRVNNPTLLRVNGKRVGMDQFASTKVTSTYEVH